MGDGDYSRVRVPLSLRLCDGEPAVTTAQALAFVRTHGVVLESASGPVPSLTAAIVGEPIRGNWWGHPQSHRIFQITRAVRGAESVLVCRLLNRRVTLVHKRLWPAVVRLADRFPPAYLAWIVEIHTPAGHHRVEVTPFPDWVPAKVLVQAGSLSERDARRALGSWVPPGPNRR